MEARRIDRYELLEEVGSGGMAVVFKGLDTTLHREVAVKIMHPHLANREESRRRFSREARAVARLRHPAIVEIYDFSDDETRQSFLVTEFVPGRTLRAFSDEVGFGLPELAALAAHGLAEALEHAHENGIVHRDLKPENVMVRSDGQLKLMDFGIARILEGERMTMTGALVGSPLHMAPEIIEGKDAGESADIFALGTILYWMITGEMAFAGNNTTQTLRRILEGEFRDPRTLAPSCSDELAELVGRCLSREPANRPAHMGEFRAALASILAPCGIERPDEALKGFFLDPETSREALRRQLIERLTREGEEALAQKRAARALSIFDRVLALDEGNEKVLRHLEQMKRSRVVKRRLQVAGAVALGGVLALGGIYGFVRGSVGGGALPSSGRGAAGDVGAPGGGDRPALDPTGEGTGTLVGSDTGRGDPGAIATASIPAEPVEGPGAGTSAPAAVDAGDGSGSGTPGSLAAGGPADGPDAGAEAAATAEPAGGQGAGTPTTVAAAGPADTPGAGVAAAIPSSSEKAPRRAVSRTVHLRWVPQSAVLTIDGKRIETTAPSWSGTLEGGAHTLTLSHPDCCVPWEETLEIDSGGEPIRRSVALAPKGSGWFLIDTDESSAEVWVDGTFKGTVAEVNARGGVPVPFSREDTGRERYVKTVRFELLPPRGNEDLVAATGEVVVRSGQRSRSRQIKLQGARP